MNNSIPVMSERRETDQDGETQLAPVLDLTAARKAVLEVRDILICARCLVHAPGCDCARNPRVV